MRARVGAWMGQASPPPACWRAACRVLASTRAHRPACPPPPHPPRTLCSYGAFWMSLAIFSTLSAGGVFVATPEKGDRLMLVLWGILVSSARAGIRPRRALKPACLRARVRTRALRHTWPRLILLTACRPSPTPPPPRADLAAVAVHLPHQHGDLLALLLPRRALLPAGRRRARALPRRRRPPDRRHQVCRLLGLHGGRHRLLRRHRRPDEGAGRGPGACGARLGAVRACVGTCAGPYACLGTPAWLHADPTTLISSHPSCDCRMCTASRSCPCSRSSP